MEDNAGNVQSVVAPAESQSATSQSPAPQSPSPKARKRKPLTFGATMLASALGFILSIVVVNAICILLGIIFIVAVMAGQKTTTTIDNNIAVKVDLSHPLVEQPVSELESIFSNTERPSIHQLLTAISDAKNDARVRALYLYAGNGGAISWAQSEELRNAVMDFQSSGKPVVAFGNSFSQPTYYLVSVADRVCLNPAGMVDFRGLCAETLFFKDMLDRLGISVDLIRPNNNAFKSAGETYTMTHFSEANKQQVRSYLQDIWNYAVARISLSRSISVDSLNLVADNLEAILASEAYGAGLVDTLCFESDIQNFLESKGSARKTMSAVKYDDAKVKTPVADKIAVVYAEGDVMSGKGDGIQHNVYSDDFVAALKKATADSSVKAIVLRINSPGGSAIASESMTDAVVRAKAVKPVVVSMSSLAASAGYEMASNASYIVAQPLTLTGSIGVFGVLPEVGAMLRGKLGITTDTVATNANAAGMSIMRPASPAARAMLQRNVEDFYVNFCVRVATGRGLDVEYVDSIARGRVWTGLEAQRIGLVDTLGGMNLAMQVAAQKAGINNYEVKVFPEPKDVFTQMMDYASNSRDSEAKAQMRQLFPLYDDMCRWATMDKLQARLPFLLNID